MEAKQPYKEMGSATDRQIELQMITYVENNTFFDFSDDLDGKQVIYGGSTPVRNSASMLGERLG